MCIHGYIDYLRNRIQGHGDLSITEERKKLVRAQTEKNEIEIEVLRGGLVDREAIKKQSAEIFKAVRTEILGLSGRLANELASTQEPAKCRAILQEEHRRALNSMSDKLKRLTRKKL